MGVAVKNSDYMPERSFVERFLNYSGSAIGALRSSSLIRNLSRLYNEIAKTPSPAMRQLENVSATTISGLGVVRLPSATQSAYADVAKLGETDPNVGLAGRKIGVAFRSVMDGVAAWAGAGALLTANPTLRNVATLADFSQDAADVGISWNDYNQSLVYEKSATGEVEEAFAHTRKYNMLRLAKAVLSFAAGFFAVWMLITGVTVLPLVLSILLSLATTMIAIRRDIFKDEGQYKLVDLSQPYSMNS